MPRGLPTILFILLTVLALGVGAWWVGQSGPSQALAENEPALTTSRALPAGGWGPLRVMTCNVRLDEPQDGANGWMHRRELLVKTLLKYQPEVIACQEVSPVQGAYLQKELAPWYAYYPRAGASSGTAPGQGMAAELLGAINDTLSSLNTIFYRGDRFELLDGEAGLVLPDDPQKDASENTFFTLAVLREKRASGDSSPASLIVVDVHLRHNEAFAAKCAQRLRGIIGKWNQKYPHAGIVVMGDMNRAKGTKGYAELTMPENPAPVLVDTFDYSKIQPGTLYGTYHAFTGKTGALLPTDLIFTAGALTPTHPAEILRDSNAGQFPTDHFPVQVDLNWK